MWSKTKVHLKSLLCDSLKDRVDFFCSNYRIHDGIGRTYITVDGKEVYNMCTLKSNYYGNPIDGLYSQVEFMEALNTYFNSSVESLLKSDNPLIRILILLDRRIGKQRLKTIGDQINTSDNIVYYFYQLRCEAEGIKNKVQLLFTK